MADPKHDHRPAGAGDPRPAMDHAPDRSAAEDAAQRPGVAASRPADTSPGAGRRWATPVAIAALAILVLLLIVFL